jgi:hypothetical protein
MPSVALATAVENYLAAGFTALPIIGAIVKQAREKGDAFVTVQYPTSSSGQMSIGSPGSNVWRTEGTIRFVITGRKEGGAPEAMAWADEIADLFRGKHFDGVRTEAPSSPTIDNDNDKGMFYGLSFIVPYAHDYLG